MPDAANPYQSPSPASQTQAEAEYMRRARRPQTPKVLGILCLVFSALGLIGLALSTMSLLSPANPAAEEQQAAMMEIMGYHPIYIWGSQILGAILAAWLLLIGIGLIRYRRYARLWFNGYGLITIIMQAGNMLYLMFRIFASGVEGMMLAVLMGSIVGGLVGLIFPVLGMIFVNRPHVVASLD